MFICQYLLTYTMGLPIAAMLNTLSLGHVVLCVFDDLHLVCINGHCNTRLHAIFYQQGSEHSEDTSFKELFKDNPLSLWIMCYQKYLTWKLHVQ